MANTSDGGVNGWIVVFACHVCNMFLFGLNQAIGPVFVAMQTYFDSGSARTSWIVSVFLCFALGFGPIANMSVKKIGYRCTVILGGLVSSIGFLLTAFAPSLEFIYFSFGVLIGIGYGLIISPHFGIIGVCVKKQFALANALVVCGSGTGVFIFTPLWQLLIDMYGWRGAFIVFAAINANLCVCGALFKIPKIQSIETDVRMTLNESVNDILPDENETREKYTNSLSFVRRKCEVCECGLFCRYPTFALYTFGYFLGFGLGFFGVPAYIVARAKHTSLGSASKIALSMSVFGAFGIFGRLVPVAILRFRLPALTSGRLFGLSLILVGLTNILSSLVNSYTAHFVYTTFLGIFVGIFSTMTTQVVKDALGPRKLMAGVALSAPLGGLGGLVSLPLAGWIYDTTSDYNNSFYFYGSCSMLAGIAVLLFEPFTQRRHEKLNEESIASTDDMDEV
ncbi:monocarboxylate transporter 12-like [Glandiceps talaboti]